MRIPHDIRWARLTNKKRGYPMSSHRMPTIAIIAGVFAVVGGWAMSAQDKYTLKVPNGLAFSEFRGYESWQVVSISQDGNLLAATLANPVMIKAYLAGIPGNGKPFPDGAKLAKIHWNPKKMETFPAATVPGTQHDVDFMVKDSKRFADSGGWGWAVFDYDAASDTFRPGTLADKPPQGNDAKCGFACHTIVKTRDYVFTDYAIGEAVRCRAIGDTSSRRAVAVFSERCRHRRIWCRRRCKVRDECDKRR